MTTRDPEEEMPAFEPIEPSAELRRRVLASVNPASRWEGFVARFAAILQTKRQGPETTIAMLEQMRDQATSQQTREVIERSVRDAQAAWDIRALEDAVAAYRAREGRLPASLDDLVAAGQLRFVPPDRYGGTYELDPASGAVRSSTGRKPLALHTSPLAKRLHEEATR